MPKTKLHAFTSVSFGKSRGSGDFKSNSLVDGGAYLLRWENKGKSRLRQSRGGQEGFQMQDTVDQERGLGWRRGKLGVIALQSILKSGTT